MVVVGVPDEDANKTIFPVRAPRGKFDTDYQACLSILILFVTNLKTDN